MSTECYPGDLILRVGRRVCQWRGERVAPIPIDVKEVSWNKTPSLWGCGTLVDIDGDRGIVDVYPSGLWAYPLHLLEVNHKQEDMTDAQYLWGLTKIRELISDGLPLSAIDSTDIGDKYTYVSWGFEEDRFTSRSKSGKRSPVWPIGMPRRQRHQYCPLDMEKRENSGCFYRCYAFQRKSELTVMLALELYDAAIREAQRRSSPNPPAAP